MSPRRFARPVERWRGRIRVARPRLPVANGGVRSYLIAFVTGAGLIAVVVLLALLADTARPLEVVSMVVVVGAALVIVLFLATPMRNRAGNLDVDTMSDRPMGEYHESAMSSGLVVSLHALAFALPSIVTLAVLVAR